MAKHDSETGEPQRSWVRRQLMKIFGPADIGEEFQVNPLKGTKYDPEVKRAQRAGRQAKKH